MKTINIHEAKTHLSHLINRAISGEEVVIAGAGIPLVKLVPVVPPKTRRPIGIDAGKGWISDDFDTFLPDDMLRHFTE